MQASPDQSRSVGRLRILGAVGFILGGIMILVAIITFAVFTFQSSPTLGIFGVYYIVLGVMAFSVARNPSNGLAMPCLVLAILACIATLSPILNMFISFIGFIQLGSGLGIGLSIGIGLFCAVLFLVAVMTAMTSYQVHKSGQATRDQELRSPSGYPPHGQQVLA